MSNFTIQVDSEQVRQTLAKLSARSQNLQPAFEIIGEAMLERAKRRFETSTGPDGTAWKPWLPSTAHMIAERLAQKKSYRKKNGSLNAKGQHALSMRRLLVDSGSLKDNLYRESSATQLTVGSPAPYAAMHQFGGTTGAGSWIPGKTITARPFLPIKSDGTLYPAEEQDILQALNDYLMAAL